MTGIVALLSAAECRRAPFSPRLAVRKPGSPLREARKRRVSNFSKATPLSYWPKKVSSLGPEPTPGKAMDGRPGPRGRLLSKSPEAPSDLGSQSPGRLGQGSVERGRGRQSSGWRGHSAEPAVSTLEPRSAGPGSGNRLHPKSFQVPSGSGPGPVPLALEPKKAVSLSPGPMGANFF